MQHMFTSIKRRTNAITIEGNDHAYEVAENSAENSNIETLLKN